MAKSSTSFKAGHPSANPGGRPKDEVKVRDLARAHTAEAVMTLVEWMRSENAKASVSACLGLLDRGWGRPTQSVELGGSNGEAIQHVVVIKHVGKKK